MAQTSKGKRALEIGSAFAALAATAATVYMLAESAKGGKKTKSWFKGFKKEVLRNLSKTGHASRQAYHKAVDSAAKKYSAIKSIDRRELAEGAAQLKGHWNAISREVQNAAAKVREIRENQQARISRRQHNSGNLRRRRKTFSKSRSTRRLSARRQAKKSVGRATRRRQAR